MTCIAEINRCYETHRDAWDYLLRRGFTCRPFGDWENGRWAATVTQAHDGCHVRVWLRDPAALEQAA